MSSKTKKLSKKIKKAITASVSKSQNQKHKKYIKKTAKRVAKKLLKDPKQVILELSKPAEGVLQVAYLCYDTQKSAIILSLIMPSLRRF